MSEASNSRASRSVLNVAADLLEATVPVSEVVDDEDHRCGQ
jgi:hypothetical protein